MKITLLALDESNAVDVGLRLISATLKEKGYKVDMLFNIIYIPESYFSTTTFNPLADNFDSINFAAREVTDFVKENHSDLLGISVSTNHFERAARITEMVKKAKPELFIVWGGIHPTVCPEESLQYADCICIGEGEKAMLELVNRLSSGRSPYDIPSLWFKNNGDTIKNKIDSELVDINELPFQDYGLGGHYIIKKGIGLRPLNNSIMAELMTRYVTKTSGSYMIFATRGCPYSCSYCINSFNNRLYKQPIKNIIRRRSVENIIAELSYIKNNFPFIDSIFFGDDIFAFGKDREEWLEDFTSQYREKISLPFMCLMHFNQVTDKTMELLCYAGLKQLSIGIESGSERTLKDLYRRNYTPDTILERAKIVNKYKEYIIPSYDIILDNPYESDNDLRKTLELILKLLEPFHLGIYSMTFFPGVPLYQRAKSDGIITDELNQVYRKHYNDIDSSKYINKLFLLYGFIPKKMVTYLAKEQSILNRLLLLVLYHIWNCRNVAAQNFFYRLLKQIFKSVAGRFSPLI